MYVLTLLKACVAANEAAYNEPAKLFLRFLSSKSQVDFSPFGPPMLRPHNVSN